MPSVAVFGYGQKTMRLHRIYRLASGEESLRTERTPLEEATRNDWYMALAYTVRDRMMHRYIATAESIAGIAAAR
jgi:hypothetical protein